jgi:ubiquinone/menaquinone biosynthesis C-methylase UbiE
MDDIAAYNIARWRALAEADALFTRPALDLDATAAQAMIDPDGWLGDVAGRHVLCLASGGGQQSAAFALLRARVTVVDLSDAQLKRDRQVATHYGVAIETVQGDMRDLSSLEPAAFDLVWHPYSLNFVPDARVVFAQVARVLRRGGVYHVQCANPFVSGLTTADWTGEGYLLTRPYQDRAGVSYADEAWVYRRAQAGTAIPGPREFRHSLSTVINGLAELGFVVKRMSDSWSMAPDLSAPPGTWDHLVAFAPPWLAFWSEYWPDPGAASAVVPPG